MRHLILSRRRLYQSLGEKAYLFSCLVTLALCGVCQSAEPVVLEGHTNVVSSLAFSLQGTQLISGSWDKSVRVWNVETAKPVHILNGHHDWVFALVATKDGSVLSASQKTIRRWRPPSEDAEVYNGLGGPTVNAVAFSRDGKLLATGGRDGKVRLWQVGNETPNAVFEGFESWVSCLTVSANHKTLATGTRAGQIKLFNLTQQQPGRELASQSGQQVLAVAMNSAGDVLAAGVSATAQLWEVPSGKEIGKLTGHRGLITAIAWSADGKLLATGERHGSIKVWSYADGNRLIATLPGHSDNQLGFTVTALSFSPDSKLLASGSYDKSVKIWTIPDE